MPTLSTRNIRVDALPLRSVLVVGGVRCGRVSIACAGIQHICLCTNNFALWSIRRHCVLYFLKAEPPVQYLHTQEEEADVQACGGLQ